MADQLEAAIDAWFRLARDMVIGIMAVRHVRAQLAPAAERCIGAEAALFPATGA